MSIQVKQLLLEPLGNPAYWYDDILTPECKSVGKKVLTLSNVMLSCGGKPTGYVVDCSLYMGSEDLMVFEASLTASSHNRNIKATLSREIAYCSEACW